MEEATHRHGDEKIQTAKTRIVKPPKLTISLTPPNTPGVKVSERVVFPIVAKH
jgi:hypothetical protein